MLLFGNTYALKVLFTQSFYHGSYLIYEHFYFCSQQTPQLPLLLSICFTIMPQPQNLPLEMQILQASS